MTKQLKNGAVQIVTGKDEEELTANYKAFLGELEAEEAEFTIVSVQPAMLILLTEGDPEYVDEPHVSEPADSEHNAEWAKNAAADIIAKIDKPNADAV